MLLEKHLDGSVCCEYSLRRGLGGCEGVVGLFFDRRYLWTRVASCWEPALHPAAAPVITWWCSSTACWTAALCACTDIYPCLAQVTANLTSYMNVLTYKPTQGGFYQTSFSQAIVCTYTRPAGWTPPVYNPALGCCRVWEGGVYHGDYE
ncbi:uncharacterized protein LOC121300068 isoform X1 [Polyodon spathula]|uniref:uncharacterized protein LOC121300068 isoform X1 n=1 Tax=Polyodon spathula TaxID=7913 RepID=UPI001B7F1823|nr:uncharacterized protein LOC121300068 isoform X1 [Polyodon spathula]